MKSLDVEYLSFQTGKDPEKLAQRIRTLVIQNKLNHQVFRFCLQKDANPKQGRYWAFLAVAPGTSLPKEIDVFFKDQNIKTEKKRFTEKEVRKMISSQQTSLEYADPVLIYRKAERRYEMGFGTEAETHSELTMPYNQLLYWLSAIGKGNWSQFHKVSQIMALSDNVAQSREVMRSLYLLGHLEISQDGSEWEVSNPAWVQTNNHQEWFLAGARSPHADTAIRKNHQAYGKGPERWSVEKPDTHLDAGNAAEKMSLYLPEIGLWKERLAVKPIERSVHYSFERWNGVQFEQMDHHILKHSGIYRVIPNSKRFVRQYILYFDAPNQRWLQANWSGLRYLSDLEHDIKINWVYLTQAQTLCLRADQRPPLLYEKALVLASGYLPRIENHWLHYSHVTKTLAKSLAHLLRAHLKEE